MCVRRRGGLYTVSRLNILLGPYKTTGGFLRPSVRPLPSCTALKPAFLSLPLFPLFLVASLPLTPSRTHRHSKVMEGAKCDCNVKRENLFESSAIEEEADRLAYRQKAESSNYTEYNLAFAGGFGLSAFVHFCSCACGHLLCVSMREYGQILKLPSTTQARCTPALCCSRFWKTCLVLRGWKAIAMSSAPLSICSSFVVVVPCFASFSLFHLLICSRFLLLALSFWLSFSAYFLLACF